MFEIIIISALCVMVTTLFYCLLGMIVIQKNIHDGTEATEENIRLVYFWPIHLWYWYRRFFPKQKV
jgi:hypothetical protein